MFLDFPLFLHQWQEIDSSTLQSGLFEMHFAAFTEDANVHNWRFYSNYRLTLQFVMEQTHLIDPLEYCQQKYWRLLALRRIFCVTDCSVPNQDRVLLLKPFQLY